MLCKIINCSLPAKYHFINQPPKYCHTHRCDCMVKIGHVKTWQFDYCNVQSCTNYAHYGFMGETPKYCAAHHTNKMVRIT